MDNESSTESLVEGQSVPQIQSDGVSFVAHREKRPLSWYWCVSLTPRHQETLARLGLRPVRLIQHHMNGKPEVAGLFHKHEGHPLPVQCVNCSRQDLLTKANNGSWRMRFLSNVRGIEEVRLNVGYESREPTSTRLHMDLSSLELHALLAESLPVVDIITYEVNSVQRFALITDTQQPATFVLTGASTQEINSWLKQTRLVLRQVRSYLERDQIRFMAVAGRSSVQRWSWVANVNADVISSRLRSQELYPVDLDIAIDDKGRSNFSAVFYRWKP